MLLTREDIKSHLKSGRLQVKLTVKLTDLLRQSSGCQAGHGGRKRGRPLHHDGLDGILQHFPFQGRTRRRRPLRHGPARLCTPCIVTWQRGRPSKSTLQVGILPKLHLMLVQTHVAQKILSLRFELPLALAHQPLSHVCEGLLPQNLIVVPLAFEEILKEGWSGLIDEPLATPAVQGLQPSPAIWACPLWWSIRPVTG